MEDTRLAEGQEGSSSELRGRDTQVMFITFLVTKYQQKQHKKGRVCLFWLTVLTVQPDMTGKSWRQEHEAAGPIASLLRKQR